MPFSLRLDPATEEQIDRLARERGTSRASVVREAVAKYAASKTETTSPYERLKPFIGAGTSERSDLSTQTGRKFTELLQRRRATRARRTR